MSSKLENRSVLEKAAREADITLTLLGDIPMFFRRITAGHFTMGSRGYSNDEEPIHRVYINQEFYLGTFAVTQEQYGSVAARSGILKEMPFPSRFKGLHRPVELVNWRQATAFCQWLANWRELPQKITDVRLPTEAEWEYACRAGFEAEYYTGDGEAALAKVGWYCNNSDGQTHSVGEKQPNDYGLYDMVGNVWEWCRDIYDVNAYRKRIDGWMTREWTFMDTGPDAQAFASAPVTEQYAWRVLRGGSWDMAAFGCLLYQSL